MRSFVLTVILSACGSVNPQAADAPSVDDMPACNGCIANGQTCTLNSECTSTECTCNNASCSQKVCSPTACACGYSSTGATCDGNVGAGVTDTACAGGCDGTGACKQPLLWFKFDEPAGGVAANTGTWPGTVTSVGGTLGVAGKVGTAISLAQATDGVLINDPADNSLDSFASWTAEAWINITAFPMTGNMTIVKKNNGYICRLVTANNVYTDQGIVFTPGQQPANYQLPAAPTTNTWYHAACTFAAGTLKLYWNGVVVATTNGIAGTIVNSASGLGIGKADTGGENLVGLIDDFKMWTDARNDRQICIDACGSYSGTTCTFDGICGN